MVIVVTESAAQPPAAGAAEAKALVARAAAAAAFGLAETAARMLAEAEELNGAAALAEIGLHDALAILNLGGGAVGGARRLAKERRLRAQRAEKREQKKKDQEAREARAKEIREARERQLQREHELKMAAIAASHSA